MIEAVIFDMDGLMFDTERMYQDAAEYAGLKLGVARMGEYSIQTMGRTSLSIAEDMRRDFGIDPDVYLRHVEDYKIEFFANNPTPVKKGLYELLTYLKQEGYKMAIASSSVHEEILHNINSAGVAGYFDTIVSGDMVKNSKPAPDPFVMACEKLGVAPEKAIALEDSNNGIRSAYAAGLKAVMIPDLAEPAEDVRAMLYALLPDMEAVIGLLTQGM